MSAGNANQLSLALNGNAVRATLLDKHTLGGSATYTRSRLGRVDKTTVSRWAVFGQHDRNLTPRVFAHVKLGLEADPVVNLMLRRVPAVGLGYKFIDTPQTSFNVFWGAAHSMDRYDVPQSIAGVSGLRFSRGSLYVGSEASHTLTGGTQLRQRLEVYSGVLGDRAVLVRLMTGVAVPLTRTLNLKVRLTDSYDSRPPAGIRRNDLGVFTGVQLRFGGLWRANLGQGHGGTRSRRMDTGRGLEWPLLKFSRVHVMSLQSLLDQVLKSGLGAVDQARSAARAPGAPGDMRKYATGAAVGGVLGLLMGNRRGRSMGGSLAKYGGVAAIGALAWKAYQEHQARQGAQSASAVGATGAAGAPGVLKQVQPSFDALPAPVQEQHSRAMLKALIAAAKADGHMDERERDLVQAELHRLDADPATHQWVDAELRRPVEPAEVAAAATTPEMAAEIYLASLLVVDQTTTMERAYLDELARQLNLAPALKADLEVRAAA